MSSEHAWESIYLHLTSTQQRILLGLNPREQHRRSHSLIDGADLVIKCASGDCASSAKGFDPTKGIEAEHAHGQKPVMEL